MSRLSNFTIIREFRAKIPGLYVFCDLNDFSVFARTMLLSPSLQISCSNVAHKQKMVTFLDGLAHTCRSEQMGAAPSTALYGIISPTGLHMFSMSECEVTSPAHVQWKGGGTQINH